ncbi:type I restriction endonuclease subunit R [Sphingomonas panacisoli]|uniref:Type I restriction enzyme endonuclease subunit n=1 Tax=Sphingomonas panacisoli TaxID=1813879 RepID=A0A5B8LIW6_9SPHN|nr:HsdR family type I site-specific deoxyribonuclease [Sphingomonas panacisoli]QDZ08217.1 type I restriction endonuclease subunit R [Sphingomonas panacisoli]
MTSPDFATSEAGGVQLQALHTLAGLGWRYLTRAEGEAQRRGRLAETLLEDVLAERLHALNPLRQGNARHALPGAAAQVAIRRLSLAIADQGKGLLGANAAVTDLLRLGTSVDVTLANERGEAIARGRQLRFVDWDDPAANLFHMTAEFPVQREGAADTRRPDIVLFVNGIPFAVIEVKSSVVGTEQGISQQLRNQGPTEIPRLFASAQLLIAANPSDPRFATTGTAAQFWALWREHEIIEAVIHGTVNAGLAIETSSAIFADFSIHRRRHEKLMEHGGGRQPTPLDRLLVSLCGPTRLLDIARGYTLFDAGDKKVPRYQQYFGVRRAIDRLKTRDEADRRRGGVIWHTQGSGKSLTMVMLAGEIIRAVPNARIVLVTDRTDLDIQIRDTFKDTGKEVVQADSGADLGRLIRARTDIITTLIHKFRSLVERGGLRDEDPDVFLLVDESHRSQTVTDDESMHRQMRAIFPRACYIGFTGTPLLKRERSTFTTFGGLIHSYKIDEAVRDKAVVPLLYEGRHVDMDVEQDGLDRWFERVTKALTDDQKTDLKHRMGRANEVLGATPWLREVAFDVSEDFARNWQGTPFRGQLVARGKREAVLLKQLIKGFGDVTAEVIISDIDDREGHDEVADEDDDIVRAHIRQAKALHGDLKTFERFVIQGFKAGKGPDILIVVDKLLTGFDAPRNRVLYLAKSLKEHGLLQAIARVNRLYQDDEAEKTHGHIVDYAGVLGELDKALTSYQAFADYDEGDVAQALVSIREETERLPDTHAALLDLFKGIENAADQEAYELLLAEDLIRRDFYERLRAFASALQSAFTSQDWVDRTPERTIRGYKDDLKRFESLRRAVARRYADDTDDYDAREYQARIRKLLDQHITTAGMIELVPPVDIFDETVFKQAVEEATGGSASVADAIASATARTINERMGEDPIRYKRFSAIVAEAIEEFRAGRLSEADYLARVTAVRDEIVGVKASEDLPEAVRGDDFAGAVWRILREALLPLAGDDVDHIATDVTSSITAAVRAECRVGWQDDIGPQNAMRAGIDDILYDRVRDRRGIWGLDAAAMDEIADRIIAVARRQLPR